MKKTWEEMKSTYALIKKSYPLSFLFYLAVAYYLFFDIFAYAIDFSIVTGTLLLNIIFYFVVRSLVVLFSYVNHKLNIFTESAEIYLDRILAEMRYIPRNLSRFISTLF